MRQSVLLIILGIISLVAPLAYAATNDFIIQVDINDDVIPPSTPTLLSVEPIAYDQIDIDWSVSTDNRLMGGYVLWRDGSPIATTTLTSYSDTGLSAETLYSYYVYAFDAAGNISTTSNSLSTTTPAAPLPPPAPTSTTPINNTQSTLTLRLSNFAVEVTANEAQLSWQTNIPTRYLVRWGRTDSYTGGYSSNEAYRQDHITSITDLEPGTVYQYEIIGYSPSGLAISLKTGTFTTAETKKDFIVPNVERLTAVVENNKDVLLSYRIPSSVPSYRIRIVRSYLDFPQDIYDGAVVYEGRDTTFFDRDAFREVVIQYYTVFVIAEDGSVSSGAVVRVEESLNEVRDDVSNANVAPRPTSTGQTETPSPVNEEIFLESFDINSIVITQNGEKVSWLSEQIELSAEHSFNLSIIKEALPRHLKSIIVTLLDPTDQRRSYSFLLRLNKAGTAYEAEVSALGVVGSSKLTVAIYDFDQLVIGRYAKAVDFLSKPNQDKVVVFPDTLVRAASAFLPFLGIGAIGLIIFLFLLMWRRRKAEDNR